MIRGASELGPPIPAELLAIPDELMPEADGMPMESAWQRLCMCLLIEVIACRFKGRDDFYVGGNMCMYYSHEQVMKKDFLGPDFFFVKNINRWPQRTRWIVWLEGMRTPTVIVELLSPSTAARDLGEKKRIYEREFQTPEYFCYAPETNLLQGWRLTEPDGGHYEPLLPNERGWLWCAELQMWLGSWKGKYLGDNDVWLRFYDEAGRVVPIAAEEAEARAKQETQRADAAEAELARLRALIAQQKSNGGKS